MCVTAQSGLSEVRNHRAMLAEFITSHREELLERCQFAAALRNKAPAYLSTAITGIPAFLTQLVESLVLEQSQPARLDSHPQKTPAPSAIGRDAAAYGARLLSLGFSVDQVVHEYGDVCQSVTGLAIEKNTPISSDEFRTLNRCLDNAIADAVTPFEGMSSRFRYDLTSPLHARIDAFSFEQARLLLAAAQAFSAIRTGRVAVNGHTGQLVGHILSELQMHLAQHVPQIQRDIAALGGDPGTEQGLTPTPVSGQENG
ncbi:MAG: hypothetical protein ABW186_08115 [Rhodanobacteraceae bacterium]